MKLVGHNEEKELYLDRQTHLDILIHQDADPNIYVGFCNLGYCIRAKRNISEGEFIYRFAGRTISFLETTTRGECECMSLQYEKDKYIDTEVPGRFVNHSCEPNAGLFQNFDLKAIVDIPIHHEITFDYSTSMDEDHYQMECLCGTPSCRKIVTDFKLLPSSVQRYYLNKGIVMDFIKNKY